MSTYDNAPPLPDWVCEPRPCPIPCCYCSAPYGPVAIPANVILGCE